MNRFPHANPWSNVVGLARTLLALSTMTTLIATSPQGLFSPMGSSMHAVADRFELMGMSFFLLFPLEHIEWARWIAVAILAVVASGWRPRFTGLFHWWISVSFASTAMVIEGGDQIAAVLTLFLIPVTLTDSRKWHWDAPPEVHGSRRRSVMALCALTGLVIVRIQMSVIYFNSGVAKMSVTEWSDGTALYYWFTEPMFGMPGWMEGVAIPVLAQPWIIVTMTWGVMIFEVLLSAGLLVSKRWWTPLLLTGITFHAGIAVVHGLVSFSIVMTAGLLLYFRPVERPFSVSRTKARIGSWAQELRLRFSAERAPRLEHGS